ncbi:MAG: hypothetical protein U0836_11345 [Pirellulales bacterium]
MSSKTTRSLKALQPAKATRTLRGRRANLRILTLYDDNRTDLAGEVARLVSSTALK